MWIGIVFIVGILIGATEEVQPIIEDIWESTIIENIIRTLWFPFIFILVWPLANIAFIYWSHKVKTDNSYKSKKALTDCKEYRSLKANIKFWWDGYK